MKITKIKPIMAEFTEQKMNKKWIISNEMKADQGNIMVNDLGIVVILFK